MIKVKVTSSGWIQHFPEGGATLLFGKMSWKCMEMKKLVGGGRPKFYWVDSPVLDHSMAKYLTEFDSGLLFWLCNNGHFNDLCSIVKTHSLGQAKEWWIWGFPVAKMSRAIYCGFMLIWCRATILILIGWENCWCAKKEWDVNGLYIAGFCTKTQLLPWTLLHLTTGFAG